MTRKKTEIHARLSKSDYDTLISYIGADGLDEMTTLSDVVRTAIRQFIENNSSTFTNQIQLNAEVQSKLLKLETKVENQSNYVKKLESDCKEKDLNINQIKTHRDTQVKQLNARIESQKQTISELQLKITQAEINLKAQQELIKNLQFQIEQKNDEYNVLENALSNLEHLLQESRQELQNYKENYQNIDVTLADIQSFDNTVNAVLKLNNSDEEFISW